MSNHTDSPVRWKDFVWSGVLLAIALFLFFFVYSIVALFPVWNEMRNFPRLGHGLEDRLDGPYIRMRPGPCGSCALYASLLARRAHAAAAESPGASVALLAHSRPRHMGGPLRVLYLKTGELFLNPEYRYGLDLMAPWLLALCGVISLGVMAFFEMKARRSPMQGRPAAHSAALASFAFALLFILFSYRSFSERTGAATACAPGAGQEVESVNPSSAEGRLRIREDASARCRALRHDGTGRR
jgi:hypothetical protein